MNTNLFLNNLVVRVRCGATQKSYVRAVRRAAKYDVRVRRTTAIMRRAVRAVR